MSKSRQATDRHHHRDRLMLEQERLTTGVVSPWGRKAGGRASTSHRGNWTTDDHHASRSPQRATSPQPAHAENGPEMAGRLKEVLPLSHVWPLRDPIICCIAGGAKAAQDLRIFRPFKSSLWFGRRT